MLIFVARRLGLMLLTAFVLTFVVFYLTNLPPNLEKLARSEGSVRMSDEAVAGWIEQNGHGGSVFLRYGQWLGVVPGWTSVDENGVTLTDMLGARKTVPGTLKSVDLTKNVILIEAK